MDVYLCAWVEVIFYIGLDEEDAATKDALKGKVLVKYCTNSILQFVWQLHVHVYMHVHV